MDKFKKNELRRALLINNIRISNNNNYVEFDNIFNNLNINDLNNIKNCIHNFEKIIKEIKFFPNNLIDKFLFNMKLIVENYRDNIIIEILFIVKLVIFYNIDIITDLEEKFNFYLILDDYINNSDKINETFRIISYVLEILNTLLLNNNFLKNFKDNLYIVELIFNYINKYKTSFHYKEFNTKIFWSLKNLLIYKRENKITIFSYQIIEKNIDIYFDKMVYNDIFCIDIKEKNNKKFYIEFLWLLNFYIENKKDNENINFILLKLLIRINENFLDISTEVLIPFTLLLNKITINYNNYDNEKKIIIENNIENFIFNIFKLNDEDLKSIIYKWLSKIINQTIDNQKLINYFESIFSFTNNEENKYFYILMNKFSNKFKKNGIDIPNELQIKFNNFITNYKYNFKFNEDDLKEINKNE